MRTWTAPFVATFPATVSAHTQAEAITRPAGFRGDTLHNISRAKQVTVMLVSSTGIYPASTPLTLCGTPDLASSAREVQKCTYPAVDFALEGTHFSASRGAVPDAEGRGSQNAFRNLPQGRACSGVVTHKVVLSLTGYSGNIHSAWGESVSARVDDAQ